MRTMHTTRSSLIIVTVLSAAALSACASTATAPATQPAKAAETRKAPQCYSGDEGKFFDVGASATVAGVAVKCEATADGKSAQWMGTKHAK
ncbi:MAG: hypothetical protein OSW77_04795 [Proteobacteria bacterium]|jgi:curli biogenesis system outer membrane secretion channel CsgG|nr:hypothetical protein [Pseudomonadota bacterium]